MAGLLGFEPRYGGIKIHCLTAWRQPICVRKPTQIQGANITPKFDRVVAKSKTKFSAVLPECHCKEAKGFCLLLLAT